MEGFPKVSEEKIILLRSEYNTGIVLDEEFVRATNPEQKVYSIYDKIENALAYIKNVFAERSDIEFILYNNEQKVLHFFRSLDEFNKATSGMIY